MQIVCPKCATAYQIAATAIGGQCRSVRCVRCQNIWFVPPAGIVPAAPAAEASQPPDAMPGGDTAVGAFQAELGAPRTEPAAMASAAPSEAQEPSHDQPVVATPSEPAEAPADATGETAAVALADMPIPVENSPLVAPGDEGGARPATVALSADAPGDFESVAARRKRGTMRPQANRTRMRLSLAIVAMTILLIALLSFRKDVVRHAPQFASLYSALGVPVNLRGLAFTDLKIGNEIHDGVPVLVVEGAIVSVTSHMVDVPRLRFALRNAAGAEIYAWTTPPPKSALEPFDAMPFRGRLASPPAEGHDVQVRFFTSRDAVASAR
jgi:predicted Zn finger-like uncharacterized protein